MAAERRRAGAAGKGTISCPEIRERNGVFINDATKSRDRYQCSVVSGSDDDFSVAGAGRPTLYGCVAGGEAGAMKAVKLLRGEIETVMAQIGRPTLRDLGPDFVYWDEDVRKVMWNGKTFTRR